MQWIMECDKSNNAKKIWRKGNLEKSKRMAPIWRKRLSYDKHTYIVIFAPTV